MVINGFKANPKDSDGHILFFDVEALIIQVWINIHVTRRNIFTLLFIFQLLTEEYSQMTPGTLEVQGFTNQVCFFCIF